MARVGSKDNIADILTKPLARLDFQQLCHSLGAVSLYQFLCCDHFCLASHRLIVEEECRNQWIYDNDDLTHVTRYSTINLIRHLIAIFSRFYLHSEVLSV